MENEFVDNSVLGKFEARKILEKTNFSTLENENVKKLSFSRYETESELLLAANERELSTKELKKLVIDIIDDFDYTQDELVKIMFFILRTVFE